MKPSNRVMKGKFHPIFILESKNFAERLLENLKHYGSVTSRFVAASCFCRRVGKSRVVSTPLSTTRRPLIKL
jgi:hypothetical protein